VTESDQFDPNSTPGNNVEEEDDQQTIVVTPQLIDLSLVMAVDQPRPIVGQNVTFTLTLANAGPSTATNIAVRDQLPTGLSFVDANASVGSYSDATGLWTLPSLAPGATATLQLVVSRRSRRRDAADHAAHAVGLRQRSDACSARPANPPVAGLLSPRLRRHAHALVRSGRVVQPAWSA
jgi:uncharacterized repeat protein (TIGR01451 family)